MALAGSCITLRMDISLSKLARFFANAVWLWLRGAAPELFFAPSASNLESTNPALFPIETVTQSGECRAVLMRENLFDAETSLAPVEI